MPITSLHTVLAFLLLVQLCALGYAFKQDSPFIYAQGILFGTCVGYLATQKAPTKR
ncbi:MULTISPECIES: hypothetical protein [Alphaproteobacteria]|uniref:hypothetical protein n=1 Tax=Alphaproteobacteria TaxID=28211 RepID=UPI0026377803|nr:MULTISPECIES: hypothetical protein [Alphaproteobacteria]